MGMSEREGKVKDTETVFEAIKTENFPHVNVRHQPTGPESSESTKQDKCKNKQKTQPTKQKTVPRKPYSDFREWKIKPKTKDKILKEPRGIKHLTCRGAEVWITSHFSAVLETRRKWSEMFQVLREKTRHPRILYAAELFYKSEGKNTFWDKQKLRRFVACRSAL